MNLNTNTTSLEVKRASAGREGEEWRRWRVNLKRRRRLEGQGGPPWEAFPRPSSVLDQLPATK